MKGFLAIVAADDGMGIGRGGHLPWHLPGDLAYFKKMTLGEGRNAVIMGRKTWESIPPKWRPLRGRANIVLTRDPDYDVGPGAEASATFDEALGMAQRADEIWVVGGAKIYELAFSHMACEAIYLTQIEGDFECDVLCPNLDQHFVQESRSPRQEEGGVGYRFTKWTPRATSIN
jgi:dihydrofolate reductase